LSLRLRVALANLEGEAIALGAQFIRELASFENASPPVLACICDASFDRNDFSRAEELLDLFVRQFSESDFMRAAFKLRTFGQISVADYEGALETLEEAQENYGVEYDMAWTQLAKAEALLELDRFDEAYEANLGVLNVRAWRGAAVAQATYQLGLVEETRGEALKAFGFYQRTYFQYKGHAGGHWAAEAYVASARCLAALGLENDRRNTFRAMLFDPFVNQLAQADVAREILGAAEVAEIEAYIETGGVTNIAVEVDAARLRGAL
jgi:tetratricopeptide (TPR) repeat protein